MSFPITDYKKVKVVLDFSSSDVKKHSEINGLLKRIPTPSKEYAYFFNHNDSEFAFGSYNNLGERYKFYMPIGICTDDKEIIFGIRSNFEYIIKNNNDYYKGCNIQVVFNDYNEIDL